MLIESLRPWDEKWLPGIVDHRCIACTYIIREVQEKWFVHVKIYLRGCLKVPNQWVVHFLVWCQAQIQALQRNHRLRANHELCRSPLVLLQSNLCRRTFYLCRVSGMPVRVVAPHHNHHVKTVFFPQARIVRRSTRTVRPSDWHKP